MAYDQSPPVPPEKYVSYPHYYLNFKDNEKRFKGYIAGYINNNEPCLVPVGITPDLKLVCKPNPNNTIAMVNARRDELKKAKSKSRRK